MAVFTDERFIAGIVILGMILIVTVFVVVIIKFLKDIKLSKENNKYLSFSKFMKEKGFEEMQDILYSNTKKIEKLYATNVALEDRIMKIEKNLAQCIQKVAILRYNAFEDTGSNQSYSIALLDYYNDGVVLSSIYSREGSVTFSKPVLGGKSSYTLSAEEASVIEQAVSIKTQPIEGVKVIEKIIENKNLIESL